MSLSAPGSFKESDSCSLDQILYEKLRRHRHRESIIQICHDMSSNQGVTKLDVIAALYASQLDPLICTTYLHCDPFVRTLVVGTFGKDIGAIVNGYLRAPVYEAYMSKCIIVSSSPSMTDYVLNKSVTSGRPLYSSDSKTLTEIGDSLLI